MPRVAGGMVDIGLRRRWYHIGMPDLIIYTLRSCPTCARAKADMDAGGVEYEERSIDDNAQYYQEAVGLAFTVPILVRNGRVEVGWKGESG